jgi:hypothetical protein
MHSQVTSTLAKFQVFVARLDARQHTVETVGFEHDDGRAVGGCLAGERRRRSDRVIDIVRRER